MTRQRSFKRLVRGRMEKTGEAPLLISDEAIRERTGRGWEEWFDLLDEWGALERTHREIARHVSGELGIHALGWDAQAITVSYERARGMRAVGERSDGFGVSASKTVAVPVERLFDAFVEEARRERWLPDGELRERTATRPKSARFDWGDGATRVHATFTAKGGSKSSVAVEHLRLPDADEAERRKAYWRERLAALRSELEGGEPDT